MQWVLHADAHGLVESPSFPVLVGRHRPIKPPHDAGFLVLHTLFVKRICAVTVLLSAVVANGSAYCVNIPNNIKTGGCSTGVLRFFRRVEVAHSVRILHNPANIAYTSIGVTYRYLSCVSCGRQCLGVNPSTSDISSFGWISRRTCSRLHPKKTAQRTSITGTWSVFMPVLRSTQGTVNWSPCECIVFHAARSDTRYFQC